MLYYIFFLIFSTIVKTATEFNMHEIKINHTAGQKSCPLISGLQPGLHVLSTTAYSTARNTETPNTGTPEHQNIPEHSGTPRNTPKNPEHPQENQEHLPKNPEQRKISLKKQNKTPLKNREPKENRNRPEYETRDF